MDEHQQQKQFNRHMKVNIQSSQPKYDYRFNVDDRGIVGVYGISGSGKSSLLDAIAGYQDDFKGIITFNNKPLQRTVKCSYMNQHPILFPHWTVAENLYFALKYSNNSVHLMDELLSTLDCNELLKQLPSQLSGGEKQRIAFIRALLLIEDGSLVLLDEPFSALDNTLRKTALDLLNQYKRKSLIFFVTHDIAELYQLSDNLLYLKDGKITYQDKTENAMHSQYGNLPLASKITFDGDKHIIYADDVSISLQINPQSSIVHQINSTIQQIDAKDDICMIKLKLNNGNSLYAKITKDSLNRLNLKENQQIVANFKATSAK